MSKNPNELYDLAAKKLNPEIDQWGNVPRNVNEAVSSVKMRFLPNAMLEDETTREDLQKLKKILVQYHKEKGIYNSKVERNIELIDNGSILAGQQPVLFGGPGLIANKIASMLVHVEILKEKHDLELAPIFFIGDYDGLQKELARQYFPNPLSHSALILDSEDFMKQDETDFAVHAAALPPQGWLDDYLNKVEFNLKSFIKQVKGDKKRILSERWEHIKTLLKTSFNHSNTLSDWAAQIWGTIVNIISDEGVIFLPASHPKIRDLIAPSFYHFIEKRKTYVDEFQKAMDNLVELGYHPTLPHRHYDHSPFTLECAPSHNRIPTKLRFEDDKIFATGTCALCDVEHSYDISTVEDLQKIARIIGPRVDTGQAVFQKLVNIRLRISGPGEIAYYAQVAPAIRAIGLDLPIFAKYKRTFYNSPWIEKLGKLLDSRKQNSLHQSSLFSLIRKRVDAIKADDEEGVIESEYEMEEFIDHNYQQLLKGKQSTDKQKYLGWQFGRFEEQKFGQEVSWVWFDMALQTGLSDYINTYKRVYTNYSTIGGKYYANTLL